jgi:predicted AAA+ superfamily ATPase
MLAHAQGGLLNGSQLGNSLGVSYHTIQRHLDILEQTFLVRRLPPYYRNVGKRLTKSAKIYLRDTGLLHHLLNINSLEELANHPVYGASWETFVLEDLARRERLRFPHTRFYFWRTSTGAEVDLVLDRGSKRIAIEVKAGRGDKPEVSRKLEGALADIEASEAWVIDQFPGIESLRPRVRRREFIASIEWLP